MFCHDCHWSVSWINSHNREDQYIWNYCCCDSASMKPAEKEVPPVVIRMCQAAWLRAVVHRVTYDEWCNYLHHTCDVIVFICPITTGLKIVWVAPTSKMPGSEIIFTCLTSRKSVCVSLLWEHLQNSAIDVWKRKCVLAVLDLGHLLLFTQ